MRAGLFHRISGCYAGYLAAVGAWGFKNLLALWDVKKAPTTAGMLLLGLWIVQNQNDITSAKPRFMSNDPGMPKSTEGITAGMTASDAL